MNSELISINPATLEEIGRTAPTAPSEISVIVERLRKESFKWRNVTLEKRVGIIERSAGIIARDSDSIASLMTEEMGKISSEAKAEVENAAYRLGYFAKTAPSALEPWVENLPSTRSVTRFEPIGVVAAIMPWNFPIGIYVHIPFCVKKCGYCDFYSIPVARDGIPHKEYLEAVVAQLDRDAETLGLKGRNVASVYFGGGTPSIMPPSFFEGVISAISGQFVIEKDAEISAEINPATADSNWFRSARAAGITRASIGVQSFGPRLLKTLGRIHSSEDAMRAIAKAQDARFKSVGIDLMYAIDGESVSDLEEDLRTAMTFQTEHISAYQLTVEEGPNVVIPADVGGNPVYSTQTGSPTKAFGDDKLKIEAAAEVSQLKQMRIVERMLGRGGWNRYEISNFAKHGFECRHNLNYWRYGEYLGLGAGAASFVRSQDREIARSQDREIGRSQTSFARRRTQIRDINKYIGGSREFAESEEIDKKIAMGEFCFMGLRTTEGISRLRFKKIFETEFDEVYEKECKALVEDGLLTAKDDVIALTSKGIELSNQVFQRFL